MKETESVSTRQCVLSNCKSTIRAVYAPVNNGINDRKYSATSLYIVVIIRLQQTYCVNCFNRCKNNTMLQKASQALGINT